jgi:hypothetical protein
MIVDAGTVNKIVLIVDSYRKLAAFSFHMKLALAAGSFYDHIFYWGPRLRTGGKATYC